MVKLSDAEKADIFGPLPLTFSDSESARAVEKIIIKRIYDERNRVFKCAQKEGWLSSALRQCLNTYEIRRQDDNR